MAFWLYSVLGNSNLMLAVEAVFVLVFPTAHQQFAEARGRTISTILAAAISGVILTIFVSDGVDAPPAASMCHGGGC